MSVIGVASFQHSCSSSSNSLGKSSNISSNISSISSISSSSSSSSSSGSSSRQLDACKVCGTVANVRKNFGVPSCVSCRIFYSRNTGKELTCYQNGNCRIEGPSRKSCAACRFLKCTRAGMQKSRERKYKCRRSDGDAVVVGQSKSGMKPQFAPTQTQLKQQSVVGITATPDAPVDKNLLLHFYKLANMFCAPFECTELNSLLTEGVHNTSSGLCLIEAMTKRSLSVIRFLPHFSQLDTAFATALVSEKISGLIAILRALHFDPESRLMRMHVQDKLQQQQELQQPLEHIVGGLFADLVHSKHPLMTLTELSAVSLGVSKLCSDCHRLFKDRVSIGVIVLLGVYFFLPDYKTVEVNESEMLTYQALYLRCLQELLKSMGSETVEMVDSYSRALLLLSEVKHIDFYFCLLSRHVRVQATRQQAYCGK